MHRNSFVGAFLNLALLLGTSASALPHEERDSSFNWSKVKYFLAFGDSYTYVQGTAGRQNYSFIADQLNYSFNATTLLQDKIVQNQTGTSAGGPNWVEFLTDCAVAPGLHSPSSCKKQLWDFAFAGADISTEYLPLHHNYTVSLVNQITQYTLYAHPTLRLSTVSSPSAQHLVALYIGINDINDSAKNTSIPDHKAFYNTLQSALFSSISSLYSLRFRNFLLLNLPPLDRTPSNQKSSSPSPNATQIQWWNDALVQNARNFSRSHKGSNVLVFDAHATLSAILDHPGEYGITNTTDWCAGYNQPDIATEYEKYGCPVPLQQYFWYNSGHITSRVHEILAQAVGRKLKAWRGGFSA